MNKPQAVGQWVDARDTSKAKMLQWESERNGNHDFMPAQQGGRGGFVRKTLQGKVKVKRQTLSKVTTKMEGKGDVFFDSQAGIVQSFKLDSVAVSEVVSLESGETSVRELAQTVTLKLKKPEGQT